MTEETKHEGTSNEENLEEQQQQQEETNEDTNTEQQAFTAKRLKVRVGSNLSYSASISTSETTVNDSLVLPTQTREGFDNVIDNQNSLRMSATPETKAWAGFVQESSKFYHSENLFNAALEREGSEWTQKPTFQDTPIALSRPKIGNSGGSASGESAMLRVRSLMGLGTVSNVPLYATGIWVKIKAPTDDAILTLDGLIANEKYALGRMTYGEAFSHNSVYITKHLVNFILEHVFESSLKDSSIENLRDVISELDYPTLIHGMLCTIYPNGYNLAQPCIADIGNCTHVTRAKVSIPKLLWTDHKRLTDKQKKRMSQRNLKLTNDDIESYAKESREALSSSSVVIKGCLRVSFEAPSIGNSIDTGQRWVDNIVDTIDDAMSLNSEDRNLFLINRGQAQILCTHAGWIKEISEIDEEGETVSTISDVETILLTLENLSEDSDITTTLLKAIAEFINDATISVVGIPDYECPSCNKPQLDENEEDYMGIIPLNIENIFFSLARQRLAKMLTTRAI